MEHRIARRSLPWLMPGCAAAPSEAGSEGPETKWECLQKTPGLGDAAAELNRSGADGWERVTIHPDGGHPVATFKRPKR